MNHPSIGGKEQEPQSRDVPKELEEQVGATLFPGRPFRAWWSLGSFTLGDVLAAVPPGWMKTEQGWVQMEEKPWTEVLNLPRRKPSGVYRVKQPSEDLTPPG